MSPISCWEVATLERRGRIELDGTVADWVSQALAQQGSVVVPLTALAAVAAGGLPDVFPGDPVDRLLYATARELRVPLVTRDERLRSFDPEGTVW